MLVAHLVHAEVEIAENADDVRRFLEENEDNTIALLFIDSTSTEGSEGGFWKGVVNSVSHIFSGESDSTSSKQTVAEIEKEIMLLRESGSQDAALMQIDVSNEDLREIQESYDVTTVPFLIVFKRGIVVLKEVPTHETHDKILQVLNVNPATSHDESDTGIQPLPTESVASAPVEVPPVAVAVPAPAPVGNAAPEDYWGDEWEDEFEADFTVPEEPAAAIPTSSPVIVASEPTSTPAPTAVVADKPHKITLAPGERQPAEIVEARRQPPPEEKREYVHHKCYDVTTRDDAEHWKNSPFYISELEDYEVPEDWWRNGYSPLNDTQAANVTVQKVAFSEPEVIVFEPSAPPVLLRPEPFVIAEPIRRPEPFLWQEPIVRPEPIIVAEPAYRPEPIVRPFTIEPRHTPHHHAIRPQATEIINTTPTITQTKQVIPQYPSYTGRNPTSAPVVNPGPNRAPTSGTLTSTQGRAPSSASTNPAPRTTTGPSSGTAPQSRPAPTSASQVSVPPQGAATTKRR